MRKIKLKKIAANLLDLQALKIVHVEWNGHLEILALLNR